MKAQELFLNKIKGDETFAKKVFDLENSKEDVQIIAKEAGIEISFEELEELKEEFMKVSARQEAELSEDDLDAVAGGAVLTVIGPDFFLPPGWPGPRIGHRPPGKDGGGSSKNPFTGW